MLVTNNIWQRAKHMLLKLARPNLEHSDFHLNAIGTIVKSGELDESKPPLFSNHIILHCVWVTFVTGIWIFHFHINNPSSIWHHKTFSLRNITNTRCKEMSCKGVVVLIQSRTFHTFFFCFTSFVLSHYIFFCFTSFVLWWKSWLNLNS